MANWKKVIVSGSAAELNSLALDTALTVANGGTGASSLTDGGILLGSGTNAVTATAVLGNGELLIGDNSTDPTVATLTQGSNVTITNGAGSITIASTDTNTTYTAGDGLDLSGTEFSTDLKADGGIVIESTELALDLGATSITNELAPGDGGTGITSYSTGDVLYASGATTLSKLAAGSDDDVLTLAAGVPSWATPTTGDLTAISLASNGGLVGTSLTGPIPQLSASINDFATGTVDVANDSFAFLDNDDSLTKKESIVDLIAAIDGTGLTATSGVLAVDYGSSAGEAVEGDNTLEILGTANEVDVSGGGSTALGAGNYSATIGLPSDVTIANDLTVSNNATIAGDLEVSGTASFRHSENLDIADQFITLASGSTSAIDGGIVIAQSANGSTQVGEGFGYDSSLGGQGRWGVTSSLDNDTSTIIPKHFMVTATSSVGAPSADPVYGGSTKGYGNIYVNSSTQDIYIYS